MLEETDRCPGKGHLRAAETPAPDLYRKARHLSGVPRSACRTGLRRWSTSNESLPRRRALVLVRSNHDPVATESGTPSIY